MYQVCIVILQYDQQLRKQDDYTIIQQRIHKETKRSTTKKN